MTEKIKDLESRLKAIDNSISKSVQSVKFDDGREVVYRSVNELLKARQLILNELSKNSGKKNSYIKKIIFNKGV